MAISRFEIEAAADDLQRALVSAVPTTRLLNRFPDLDVDSAYAIQLLNVKRALASGKRISGKKIGLTSKAMQNMFNVDTPDYGHLFSDMEVTNGRIERARMIQPKVEAEIAFVLSRDLDMPGRDKHAGCTRFHRVRHRRPRNSRYPHGRLEDLPRRHGRRQCLVRHVCFGQCTEKDFRDRP